MQHELDRKFYALKICTVNDQMVSRMCMAQGETASGKL